MKPLSRLSLSLVIWSLAPVVWARIIPIGTGVTTTIPMTIGRIIDVLLYWSIYVATALFIVGGLFMIGSGGSDQLLQLGKKMMKGALIGYAIVLASWMMLSTVLYFITT